jgi:tripartite ATP-independent transporter DctP family solute receptor
MFNYRGMMIVKGMVVLTAIMFSSLLVGKEALSQGIEIKFATSDAPLELTHDKTNGEFGSLQILSQVFKRIIEESSLGRIQVKEYPNSQLGGDAEMFEMIKKGSIQMCGNSASTTPTFVKEVSVIQLPFLWQDLNAGLKVMNGPFGQELNEIILKQTGVRVLGWTYDGLSSQVCTTKKKIRVPSDLKGVKLRVPPQPIMVEMIKTAGATVTPIPWPEVYTSLQQGVTDGAILPYFLIRMSKTDEVIKYVNVSNFYTNWVPIWINERFYQSLSLRDRYLVRDAALRALDTHRGILYWGDGQIIDYLKKKGIEFYVCNPQEVEMWQKAVRAPMVDWVKKQIDPTLVDKCLRAYKNAEKELGVVE